MSEQKKSQAVSQARRGKTRPQGQEPKRRRGIRPVVVFSSVMILAAAAWIALGPHGESPSMASSTADLSPSSTTASNDTNAGDPATGTPKIVFPETSYDFGAVTQGADVSHTFVVRNAGDAPLKLIEAGGG